MWVSKPVCVVSLFSAAAGGYMANDFIKGPQMIVHVTCDPNNGAIREQFPPTTPRQFIPYNNSEIIPPDTAFLDQGIIARPPRTYAPWIEHGGEKPKEIPNWIDKNTPSTSDGQPATTTITKEEFEELAKKRPDLVF